MLFVALDAGDVVRTHGQHDDGDLVLQMSSSLVWDGPREVGPGRTEEVNWDIGSLFFGSKINLPNTGMICPPFGKSKGFAT